VYVHLYQHLLIFHWYIFCPAQAAVLYDRLWLRPLWLQSEVWEPKPILGLFFRNWCGSLELKLLKGALCTWWVLPILLLLYGNFWIIAFL